MTERQRLVGLNRDEWNAAYFLGLEGVVCDGLRCDFDGQIEAGTRRLTAAGYRSGPRPLGAVPRTHEQTAHERACRELAAGTFDAIGRARETLCWLERYVPGLGTPWLRRVLACYDQAHASPAPVLSFVPDALAVAL